MGENLRVPDRGGCMALRALSRRATGSPAILAGTMRIAVRVGSRTGDNLGLATSLRPSRSATSSSWGTGPILPVRIVDLVETDLGSPLARSGTEPSQDNAEHHESE
jgi:hypothetical protein